MANNHEFIQALGMTVVHSLWQGAIITALVLAASALIRRSNAQLRYAVYLGGMVLLLASFVFSFLWLLPGEKTGMQHLPSTALMSSQTTRAVPDWQHGFLHFLVAHIEPYAGILAMGWLAGFLITGTRLAGGYWMTRIRFRQHLVEPPQELILLFGVLKARLKLRSRVHLQLTSLNVGPLVMGLFRPLILLPAAGISGLTSAQIEVLLLHELFHIRRYDHLALLVQAIATQVLFFHPLAWYLNSVIGQEREKCCDDAVIKQNNDPIIYIKTLTMIQELNNRQPACTNAMAGSSNSLLKRVLRLAAPESKPSPFIRFALVSLFLATMGITAIAVTSGNRKPNSVRTDKHFPALASLTGEKDDTLRQPKITGAVTSQVKDKQTGTAASLRVTFEKDSVTGVTLNGVELTAAEKEKYRDDIRQLSEKGIRSAQELESAHEKLRKAREELIAAEQELEKAHEKLAETQIELVNPGFNHPGMKKIKIISNLDGPLNGPGQIQDFDFQWHLEEPSSPTDPNDKEIFKHLRDNKDVIWLKKEDLWKSMQEAEAFRHLHEEEIQKHMQQLQQEYEIHMFQNEEEHQKQMQQSQQEADKNMKESKKRQGKVTREEIEELRREMEITRKALQEEQHDLSNNLRKEVWVHNDSVKILLHMGEFPSPEIFYFPNPPLRRKSFLSHPHGQTETQYEFRIEEDPIQVPELPDNQQLPDGKSLQEESNN